QALAAIGILFLFASVTNAEEWDKVGNGFQSKRQIAGRKMTLTVTALKQGPIIITVNGKQKFKAEKKNDSFSFDHPGGKLSVEAAAGLQDWGGDSVVVNGVELRWG